MLLYLKEFIVSDLTLSEELIENFKVVPDIDHIW